MCFWGKLCPKQSTGETLKGGVDGKHIGRGRRFPERIVFVHPSRVSRDKNLRLSPPYLPISWYIRGWVRSKHLSNFSFYIGALEEPVVEVNNAPVTSTLSKFFTYSRLQDFIEA